METACTGGIEAAPNGAAAEDRHGLFLKDRQRRARSRKVAEKKQPMPVASHGAGLNHQLQEGRSERLEAALEAGTETVYGSVNITAMAGPFDDQLPPGHKIDTVADHQIIFWFKS